jgi:transposase-like protein
MAKGYCIECDAALNLGKSPRKGQRIVCFKCGSTLKVTSLSPIELDLEYEAEDDAWSDSEDDPNREIERY